jgi:hypothetical protein
LKIEYSKEEKLEILEGGEGFGTKERKGEI